MRFSELPKKFKQVWRDATALKAVHDEYLEIVAEKTTKRLVRYIFRARRQIDALVRSAELLKTRLAWKRTVAALDFYAASLAGYALGEKKGGGRTNSDEHKEAQAYFQVLIGEAKDYHRSWTAWKKDGDLPWERLPAKALRRLLKGIESIQGTKMPEGGRRFLWEAPEYAQYVSKKPQKLPAWLDIEDADPDDEFMEVEEGED